MAESKTLKMKIQLRHDTAANWKLHEDVVLLAGECGVEIDTNKFKFGDGTKAWSELPYAGTQIKVTGKGDVIVGAEVNAAGELVLTKGKLLDTTVQMSDDFVFTADVGTVKVPDTGSITVAAKDKTLKEFLSALFAQAKNPSVTQPVASIKLNEAGAYEVGTKKTPSYTASLSAGSYQYGPATGIAATTYSITDGTKTLTTATGKFDEITVAENTSYKLNATITYGKGANPKNNLGTEVPSLAIAVGSETAASGAITGYRNSFWGGVKSKEGTPTSAIIRGLAGKKNGNIAAGNTGDAQESVGDMRVIIAVPAPRTITSIKDTNGLNAEAFSAFAHITVNVEGANGYDAKSYNVYYKDNAADCDKANKWHFTVA